MAEIEKDLQLKDTIVELVCNLDDMTAEDIGFAVDVLLAAGAADVFTQSIQMKKSRPGTMLTVLCHEEDREKMVALLFQHTTTLGVRERLCERYILGREFRRIGIGKELSVGEKVSFGYGVVRSKYEYDDLVKLAQKQGITLEKARNLVQAMQEFLAKNKM